MDSPGGGPQKDPSLSFTSQSCQSQEGGFLASTAEDTAMNQYWYCAHTIDCLVAACQAACAPSSGSSSAVCSSDNLAVYMSTPSVFFGLPTSVRARSGCLGFDRQWERSEPNYVFYDFNKPLVLPEELTGRFDCVVIDPPQREFGLIRTTARLLLHTTVLDLS